MPQNELFKEVLSKTTDRRRMLQRLATAGAALGVTVAGGEMQAQTTGGPSPADVVNFALNLEYLEAEFYSIATTGSTLSSRGIPLTGTGTPGATVSNFIGQPVAFGPGLQGVAQNIALDEINHVFVLRSALTANGVTPIAKPAINLDALAGLGASLGNQTGFLLLSRIFEDIGVSAYAGGAQFLSGSPFLTTAARILAIEGEHVANIRYQIARLGIPSFALDGADVPPPSSVNINGTLGNTAFAAGSPAAPFVSSVPPLFFSVNPANGLPAIRTPGQVLYLAYGIGLDPTATTARGGFFPAGVNGPINTASSSPATAANLA